MEPELESNEEELEGLREERGEEEAGGADGRRGVGGAMVSPSFARLGSTSVAPFESIRLPHEEQKRLASGISLEQEGQRIAPRLYHPRSAGLSPRPKPPGAAFRRVQMHSCVQIRSAFRFVLCSRSVLRSVPFCVEIRSAFTCVLRSNAFCVQIRSTCTAVP